MSPVTDLKAFRTLARNWEALGDIDPMFGVLSDPTKYGGRWDPAEFFASGDAHVAKLLRTLADARATFTPGRCLDFGCGVGRLTVPLSRSFQHTVGVDVAGPMIDAARRFAPADASCEFVLNRDPDLRRFESSSFDLVHSCLVLQHIPPAVSLQYIAEFCRVARPGGLVVFQVPAVRRTESEISASHALPESAYRASIQVLHAPPVLPAAARTVVRVAVTNGGSVAWPHDIPAGRHICLGNHWLHDDGRRAVDDDGRAWLPERVEPGMTVEIPLRVQAPESPGRYVLELDLVQEHICWFSQHGSPTARVEVIVEDPGTRVAPSAAPTPPPAPVPTPDPTPETAGAASSAARTTPTPWFRRLLRRLRGGTPTFEMHVVPRADVERTLAAHGCRLLRAVDDNAAGPGWLSFTYIGRKQGREGRGGQEGRAGAAATGPALI